MHLVPIHELTVEQWHSAYVATFSPEMLALMGWDSEGGGSNPPTFTEFYDSVTSHVEAGDMYAWGIFNTFEELVGQISLTKTEALPEWEMGVAIFDSQARNRGYGAKAHTKVLEFAFNTLNAEWVWAVSESNSPEVESMMERVGYRRFAHFYLIRSEWFKFMPEKSGRR